MEAVQKIDNRKEQFDADMEYLRSLGRKNRNMPYKELTREERDEIARNHTPEKGKEILRKCGFTTYLDENGIQQSL